MNNQFHVGTLESLRWQPYKLDWAGLKLDPELLCVHESLSSRVHLGGKVNSKSPKRVDSQTQRVQPIRASVQWPGLQVLSGDSSTIAMISPLPPVTLLSTSSMPGIASVSSLYILKESVLKKKRKQNKTKTEPQTGCDSLKATNFIKEQETKVLFESLSSHPTVGIAGLFSWKRGNGTLVRNFFSIARAWKPFTVFPEVFFLQNKSVKEFYFNNDDTCDSL